MICRLNPRPAPHKPPVEVTPPPPLVVVEPRNLAWRRVTTGEMRADLALALTGSNAIIVETPPISTMYIGAKCRIIRVTAHAIRIALQVAPFHETNLIDPRWVLDIEPETATLSLEEATEACRKGHVVECLEGWPWSGNQYRYNQGLNQFQWRPGRRWSWRLAKFPLSYENSNDQFRIVENPEP